MNKNLCKNFKISFIQACLDTLVVFFLIVFNHFLYIKLSM